MTMMPQARLLLTGIFNRRQQRELRVLQPVWFEIPAPDSKDYRKVISSHAGIGPETTNTLPEQFIRRCMRRCDGNLHLAARLGGVIRRNKMEGRNMPPLLLTLLFSVRRCVTCPHLAVRA